MDAVAAVIAVAVARNPVLVVVTSQKVILGIIIIAVDHMIAIYAVIAEKDITVNLGRFLNNQN